MKKASVKKNNNDLRPEYDLSQLKGKCGACEFADVCGGSRARAYALSGDPMEPEPCCNYISAAHERAD